MTTAPESRNPHPVDACARRAHEGMRRFDDMDPQQRRQARTVFMHTRGMSPEQVRAFREQWSKMSPQQRQQWLDERRPKDAPRPTP